MASDSDGKTTPSGICIHLGIKGTVNAATGERRITDVKVDGVHSMGGGDHSTPARAACSSGAVSDAYRHGWDAIFGPREEPPVQPDAGEVATSSAAIAVLDLSQRDLVPAAGRN